LVQETGEYERVMIRYDQYVIGNEINIKNIWRGSTASSESNVTYK